MGVMLCCQPNNAILDKVKTVIEEEKNKLEYTKKVIKIQAFIRGVYYRLRFKIKNINKQIRVLTRNFTIFQDKQDGFLQSNMPGNIINIESIPVNKTVASIEKILGDFEIDDKELEKCIEEQKHNRKNFSIEYQDGSFYYGYFNKEWEREGYGINIFPDGSKYQGFFEYDQMNGRGRLIGANGDYYLGIVFII
jgi:hypothetical protein